MSTLAVDEVDYPQLPDGVFADLTGIVKTSFFFTQQTNTTEKSVNMSSVTDAGTGDISGSLTNAHADVYAISSIYGGRTSAVNKSHSSGQTLSDTSTVSTVTNKSGSGTRTDSAVTVQFAGDLA